MKSESKEVFGVSLENVRNKNEEKVIKYMKELIPQFPEFDYCSLCIQDVYALSLNQLSPRYTQAGTIILKKDFKEEDLIATHARKIEVLDKDGLLHVAGI